MSQSPLPFQSPRRADAAPHRIIAFIGDVHGCVFHVLAALERLQRERGMRLEAVIQVGDLGAYRSPAYLAEADWQIIASSPAQADFFRLLHPSNDVASRVRHALDQVPPVLFVAGNHEDHEWLDQLHAASGHDSGDNGDNGDSGVAAVDPLRAFHHVACGRVIEVAGLRTAFLGRIDEPRYMSFDPAAYDHLLQLPAGSIDVLVSHDGPYGMSTFQGQTQGSQQLTDLIEQLQPRLHVSGHYHHENGPRHYGATMSYALAQFVAPVEHPADRRRDNPDQCVAPGSIGLLNVQTMAFEYVRDTWLSAINAESVHQTYRD
jgi:hypothetical protein